VLSPAPGENARAKGSSSTGRAPVSKTGGWGFESLLPCVIVVPKSACSFRAEVSVNRETKRLLQRQGQLGPDGAPAPGGPRPPGGSGRPPPGAGGAGRGASGAGRVPGGAVDKDRPSFFRRAGEYLREVRNELVKVAWPGRAEVVKYTIVVFATVVILTATVFGLDALFAKAVLLLFGH
jgi:preprotein translocase subunit SecE